MDNENEVHNAAPADRESAKKTTPLPLSIGHQRGEGVGTQQQGLSPQAQHNRHRQGQAHHGMAQRLKSKRTHVDTSADTGMLHAAQRRTQPQR